jgi:hypothetical protein
MWVTPSEGVRIGYSGGFPIGSLELDSDQLRACGPQKIIPYWRSGDDRVAYLVVESGIGSPRDRTRVLSM